MLCAFQPVYINMCFSFVFVHLTLNIELFYFSQKQSPITCHGTFDWIIVCVSWWACFSSAVVLLCEIICFISPRIPRYCCVSLFAFLLPISVWPHAHQLLPYCCLAFWIILFFDISIVLSFWLFVVYFMPPQCFLSRCKLYHALLDTNLFAVSIFCSSSVVQALILTCFLRTVVFYLSLTLRYVYLKYTVRSFNTILSAVSFSRPGDPFHANKERQ